MMCHGARTIGIDRGSPEYWGESAFSTSSYYETRFIADEFGGRSRAVPLRFSRSLGGGRRGADWVAVRSPHVSLAPLWGPAVR